MDRHGWQSMLENDGVLFWKHATRKKWAEKHAVRRILRVVYKICSVESADGVCNDSAWYACAWYCTAACNVCAAPRDVCTAPGHAIFRNGECRGLQEKLACLLDMIAQCGDPELCGKALELCSGFQERCKLSNWQWYEKNVLSNSQMRIAHSVEHLMREKVKLADIPGTPQNLETFKLDDKMMTEEFAEKIRDILELAKNLSTLELTNLNMDDDFASTLLFGVENLEKLTTVSIAHNEIRHLRFLRSLPKTISYLDMSGNHAIDEVGLQALVQFLKNGNLPNLTYFDISGVSFEDYRVSNLLDALTSCAHLTELKFRDCDINGWELWSLKEQGEKWHNLKSIDFSENSLTKIEYLLRGVKFLESLYLQNCNLGRTAIKEIGEFLDATENGVEENCWQKLKKLDLSENNIRDDEFLKWKLDKIPNLEELVVYDTHITEKTIDMFRQESVNVVKENPA